MVLINPAISVLTTLATSSRDEGVVTDALWALSYLSDGDNDRIEAVMSTELIYFLIEVLRGSDEHRKHVSPALRILGNFVTGDETQTQRVIDAGILDRAIPLLQQGKVSSPPMLFRYDRFCAHIWK